MGQTLQRSPEISQFAANPIWQAYQARIDHGQLLLDPAQSLAVEALCALEDCLAELPKNRSLWQKLSGEQLVPARGIYLWGSVGRGKTMLMDLFFHHSQHEPKRRVHFHSFMRDMHQRIHLWSKKPGRDKSDPIPPLADALAKEARLLCFDEMQITDVTDAMLIRRLFEALLARGVTMVITSNRPPEDLYLNGLQRGQFLPFIESIRAQTEVLELASPTDFRRRQLSQLDKTYYVPAGDEATQWLEAHFQSLTHGQKIQPLRLELPGRNWEIPRTSGEVAIAHFNDMCEHALGAADYMEMARQISTLLLADIPILSPAARNAAKRFVTLIDVLYEARVKLLCTAAALPDALYPKGDGSFEFARTASRLVEMQSDAYRALPWARPDLSAVQSEAETQS